MTTRIKNLEPIRESLDNGTTVLVKESRATPAVTISAALEAGSLLDQDDLLGLAHFHARTIDRGTARRSTVEIAEVLDLRGVSLGVSITRHVLTLSCNCLSEDFETILELLADVIRCPSFPDEEIVTRRGEILTAIQQDNDNPAVKAVEQLMALLYGETHPYGRFVKGTPESVKRIDRRALLRFHRSRAAPSVLSVVVVGDIDAGMAIAAGVAGVRRLASHASAAPDT